MEVVRTFLESSTIHGLGYISSTRKNVRLFWILIVIMGFSGAGLLIKSSFKSWSESPVKTTIETLPITRITLPKLTVCPPRNTFTNLNYDMMINENKTLTEEMRDEMFDFALHVIQENTVYTNYSPLIEYDRFYNRYHGYTKPNNPISTTQGLTYLIDTCATSGAITTQYYGERFQPDLVRKKLYYRVTVNPPQSLPDNKNFTLHLHLEKVSVPSGLDRLSISKKGLNFGYAHLDTDQMTFYTNFTNSKKIVKTILTRDISNNDLDTLNMDVMPGFRFKWWYTSTEVKVIPDPKYKDEERIKLHIRR